jgi:MFS family permease
MEYSSISALGLVTPAIIIAALAYLVRLFGKIASDQKAFSDDRDWEIELSGLFFFLNFIVAPGVIGYAAAHYLGSFGAGHWIHFFIVSILGGWILVTTLFLFEKIYQVKFPNVGFFKQMKDPTFRKLVEIGVGLNMMTPQWILSIIFIYVGTLEYQSGSILWFVFIGSTILFNFIFMAANGPLKGVKLSKVDVYLTGDQGVMRDLTLLKMNDNNVRLRDNDKVIILNRAQVLKVEMKIDQGTEIMESAVKDSLDRK